jgi:hypothetical protein
MHAVETADKIGEQLMLNLRNLTEHDGNVLPKENVAASGYYENDVVNLQ